MVSNLSRILNVAALATALGTTATFAAAPAMAQVPTKHVASEKVKSLNPKLAKVSVARVVDSVKLETSDGVLVSAVVEDLGGSTDVSPTQRVYLTLYAKGEMFNVDAAFVITEAVRFVSARFLSPGKYEVKAEVYEENMIEKTFFIDGSTALVNMKAVDCGGDFDCAAAENFKADIQVSSK